jgi:AcrR family transcriptional regulator
LAADLFTKLLTGKENYSIIKPSVGLIIECEVIMARTNINYEAKRKLLLKNIWDIFLEHGYENTTLAFIIGELNISKGAFYHYFRTKEECVDAAVKMFAETCSEKASRKIKQEPAADNMKHLIEICSNMFQENNNSIGLINTPDNAVFHQKLMAAFVKELAPLYAKVISQGVQEKIFDAPYPLETAQMILTLTNFYFDDKLFGWEPKDMPAKLLAFQQLFANALKAEKEIVAYILSDKGEI